MIEIESNPLLCFMIIFPPKTPCIAFLIHVKEDIQGRVRHPCVCSCIVNCPSSCVVPTAHSVSSQSGELKETDVREVLGLAKRGPEGRRYSNSRHITTPTGSTRQDNDQDIFGKTWHSNTRRTWRFLELSNMKKIHNTQPFFSRREMCHLSLSTVHYLASS